MCCAQTAELGGGGKQQPDRDRGGVPVNRLEGTSIGLGRRHGAATPNGDVCCVVIVNLGELNVHFFYCL